MYKITHINTGFQYKEIPEGINPDSVRNWTYLQIEQANCQNETNVYFQEDLPRDSEGNIVNSLYWKLVDEIVVEMTDEECSNLDNELERSRVNAEFKNCRYRITCLDAPKAMDLDAAILKMLLKAYMSPTIPTEQYRLGEGPTQSFYSQAYVNFIEGEEDKTNPTKDWAKIVYAKFANGADVFKLETNEYYVPA